jgi:tetrahydromethanopterin S-methyltransferase subunit B
MIESIVGISLFANFIAWQFTPIQDLKNMLRVYMLPGYFGKLFYCHICLGFWIGLIITQSLWLGLATSYLSHIFKFIYDKIEDTYH